MKSCPAFLTLFAKCRTITTAKEGEKTMVIPYSTILHICITYIQRVIWKKISSPPPPRYYILIYAYIIIFIFKRLAVCMCRFFKWRHYFFFCLIYSSNCTRRHTIPCYFLYATTIILLNNVTYALKCLSLLTKKIIGGDIVVVKILK